MRIGFGGDEEAANTHYRVWIPVREMARRGHRVIAPTTELYRQAFAGSAPWDVVHVFRQITEDNLESIRRLQAAGVAIVWDNDDDFSAIEKGSTGIFERRHKRRLHKLMVEMARSADLMTTTTERIADVYREEGVERIRVIPNYLDPEALRGRRGKHVGVIVGIVGAKEHAPDYERIGISRALERVQAEHDNVTVVALGLPLALERYVHVPWVPFPQLLQRVRDFDIGLAPLVDTPFNRSRSDVKLKEYAAAGVPWLASPVGPYEGMGDVPGGRLVADDEWASAIGELVADPRRRGELSKAAHRWAAGQTIAKVGRTWEATYREAIAHVRGEAVAVRTGR